MLNSLSGEVLANIARMRTSRTRGTKVLLLAASCASGVLPRAASDCRTLVASDRVAVDRASEILEGEGWWRSDHSIHLDQYSSLMAPPEHRPSRNGLSATTQDSHSRESDDANHVGVSKEGIRIEAERPVPRASFAPNLRALRILRALRERDPFERMTDPGRTDDLIREARDGGMYGYHTDED